MRFIVAPDSFKGSLSSIEAGAAIRSAILTEIPDAIVHVVPIADGGEGSVDAFIAAAGGNRVEHEASGPLAEKIVTGYGILNDNKTAIIEIAATAGLTMVPADKRNPLTTTTFGAGESIRHALDRNLRKFIIALGGSATNDGGLGMLQALGVRFLDNQGQSVPPFASSLNLIRRVDYSTIDPRLTQSVIRGACDVDNPLCGPRGASFTYGAQKGATPAQIQQLDLDLVRYADMIETHLKRSFQNINGAGAAGGIGFALLTLGARLASGAGLICEAVGMEKMLTEADWLITGEGKTDRQTLNGKAPFYLATLAAKHNVPVILISGNVVETPDELCQCFAAMHSIVDGTTTVKDAMTNAGALLHKRTREVICLLKDKQTRR